MEREILFKAKRLDNGKWVVGDLLHTGDVDAVLISDCYSQLYRCDSDTLCQYTGLTDKNGRKIWENDIVKHKDSQCFGIIRWYCGDYVGWCVYDVYDDEQQFTMDMLNECEVIGNIFDNADLLEVE